MPDDDEQPLYDHDCSSCVFLGVGLTADQRAYDLYFCEQGHLVPTVIARGSSDPHDYTSGFVLAFVDPVLREALERARKRGLIHVDLSEDGQVDETG